MCSTDKSLPVCEQTHPQGWERESNTSRAGKLGTEELSSQGLGTRNALRAWPAPLWAPHPSPTRRRGCGWGSQLGQLQDTIWERRLISSRDVCSALQAGSAHTHTHLSCTGCTYSLRKRFRSALMGCSPFSMANLSASVGSGSGISNLGGKHHTAHGNHSKNTNLLLCCSL